MIVPLQRAWPGLLIALCLTGCQSSSDSTAPPVPVSASTRASAPRPASPASPATASMGAAASASTKGPSSIGESHALARDACLARVAGETHVDASQLTVTDVAAADAGVGVTISVPGAQAPWMCTADERGAVQGSRYMGDEGKM